MLTESGDPPQRQAKHSKFLDATPRQQSVATLAPKGPTQPEAEPTSVKVACYQPAKDRSAPTESLPVKSSPGIAVQENALQVLVEQFEETMAEQMQKVTLALEASQEQRLVDLSSRIEKAKTDLSQCLDVERQERERRFEEMQRLIEQGKTRTTETSMHGTASTESVTALAQFASTTIRDLPDPMDTLRTQADAAATGIAARKAEAISRIEQLLRENHVQQQTPRQESNGTLALPVSALQTLEVKFQEVMESQIQRLSSSLSDAVEKRFVEISGKVHSVEQSCAQNITCEQQERKDAIAVLQQAQFSSTVSEATLEVVQQQVDEMRQILDSNVLLKNLPLNSQQPELTPQAPSPQAIENAMEVFQAVQEMTQELQRVDKQVQSQATEANDLRSLTKHETDTIRNEVRSLGVELNSVQTRVGEVCASTLNEWKQGRGEDISRLEQALVAYQEATNQSTGNLQKFTSVLSGELKIEREERCKSVAEIHEQLANLRGPLSSSPQKLLSQSKASG
jgi:hypothetical protein